MRNGVSYTYKVTGMPKFVVLYILIFRVLVIRPEVERVRIEW
jgi:hypothetical protein